MFVTVKEWHLSPFIKRLWWWRRWCWPSQTDTNWL